MARSVRLLPEVVAMLSDIPRIVHAQQVFLSLNSQPIPYWTIYVQYGNAHLKKLELRGLASTTWGIILWPERCVGAAPHTSWWSKSVTKPTPCSSATSLLMSGICWNWKWMHLQHCKASKQAKNCYDYTCPYMCTPASLVGVKWGWTQENRN